MSGGIGDESVLRRLIQQMNTKAPLRRLPLRELLEMPEPSYQGRDGERYSIGKEELELIFALATELGLRELRLPIVLMADASHEQSVWRVEGRAECAIISRVIGREWAEPKEKLFLYAPHVATVRRRLPTATTCAFVP
ncbi:MAG: DUF61 family protein [Thermoplasmata archaeon]